jgi:hypothetical protein
VDVAALHERFPEVGRLTFERWAGGVPWAALLGVRRLTPPPARAVRRPA